MKRRYCVVVPAYNEAVVIEATLERLIAAGTRPLDIYLVDDCSKDGTSDIARAMGVRVMRNDPNIGKALGIKRVVSEFCLTQHYEFIGLMDADTLVDITYFDEMLGSFKKKRPEVPQKKSLTERIGRISPIWNLLKKIKRAKQKLFRYRPERKLIVATCGRPISQPYNWLTAYRALNYANGHYVYRRAQGKIGMVCIAPGCATMYRSSVFNKLNWDNDTVAEDFFVTIQIYHENLGQVAYANKAKVYTQTPRTLPSYMKQMDRWYGGTWDVIRKQRVYLHNLRVDWECKLLWTEGLYSAIFRLALPLIALATPLWMHKDSRLPWWIDWALAPLRSFGWITDVPWYLGGLNAFLALTVGSYFVALPAMIIFALLERRWDIVKYSPMYPLMWYVDVVFFLKAFAKAIIFKAKFEFKSPERYVGGR